MDDFTRELGVSLLNLLWHVSGSPDPDDDTGPSCRLLVSEVIERLRGESLDHDSDFRQLAARFADRMSGRPYDKRAKQFADDFVSFVIGEQPVEVFFANIERVRQTVPKSELSQHKLTGQQRRVEEAKRNCLDGLEAITSQLDNDNSTP